MEKTRGTADARRPVLLLVDDEPAVRALVGRLGMEAGFQVVPCSGGREALSLLATRTADLAVVDVCMPDVGGLDVLKAIRTKVPSCEVILMTGFGTIDNAVEAIKLGALDYLTKPLELTRLTDLLTSVREEYDRRAKVQAAEAELGRQLAFCGMIGRGPAMQRVFSLIRRLAPHVRTLLIDGPTGTGKELAAQALYRLGPRAGRRFMLVNCSAVVETLFESELFGHVRGAFTGATDNKAGLFELADGGTLFLDEVGELPLGVQAKLLRALESGEIQRVGSTEARQVDVIVLAATNRDLRADMAAGRFRADLFYRLAVVEISMPPLADRREDIPYLTAAFLAEFVRRTGKQVAGVTIDAEQLLMSAPWEGNVRELRNVVERAALLADGDLITAREVLESLSCFAGGSSPRPEKQALSKIERDYILSVLSQTGGNKKAAAAILGISRRKLYRLLEHHDTPS